MQVEVRFTKKELEFIKCRFEQALQIKEIAPAMKVTLSGANYLRDMVYIKLGLRYHYGDGGTAAIRAMRMLAKEGIIKL